MNKTLRNILIGVVTTLLIGGGIFWYTNSSSTLIKQNVQKIETSHLDKVNTSVSEAKYYNDKYNFSFNYDSKEYSVSESKSRGGTLGEKSDLISLKKNNENCSEVNIFISTSTLEQELNNLEHGINGKTTKILIGDITATKKSGEITENIPACGSEMVKIVFEHNENIFVISTFKEWENSLNKVLESISF